MIERYPRSAQLASIAGYFYAEVFPSDHTRARQEFWRAVELDPADMNHWRNLSKHLAFRDAPADERRRMLQLCLDAARRYGVPNEPPFLDPLNFCNGILTAWGVDPAWPETAAWREACDQVAERLAFELAAP